MKSPFPGVTFTPEGKSLIKKGAEASLFLGECNGNEVIIKKREPKRYRASELDAKIRKLRTIHEARLIHEAKLCGVRTPLIYFLDPENAIIVMQYVKGERLKEILQKESGWEGLPYKIGRLIGKLHNAGIIHGDLTTSNIILTQDGEIYLIDFGLSLRSHNIEEKGVDLHLMKRSLESAHSEVAEKVFEGILEGYEAEVGTEMKTKVVKKIEEIRHRARYIEER